MQRIRTQATINVLKIDDLENYARELMRVLPKAFPGVQVAVLGNAIVITGAGRNSTLRMEKGDNLVAFLNTLHVYTDAEVEAFVM